MEYAGERPKRLTSLIALLTMLSSIVVGAAPARAASFDPAQIIFPVIGAVQFTDSFGDPRSGGRTHEATDIMSNGVKGLPVLAAADGVVSWVGSVCCLLSIDHGAGWSTHYIHLDNDTPGTDDGQGWGIAPGIVQGTQVIAGQLIGWVGDSGNAESVGPHLHFEIRTNGVAVNPYPYLLTAPRLSAPGATSYNGQFRDDDGSVHEADIEVMYARGITYGCSPEGDRYCPEDPITRGQIAAFVRRLFDLPIPATDYFSDDNGSIYEGSINALMTVGIGFGCSEVEYCPDRPLLREEMAEVLVRAFQVAPTSQDFFHDDAGSKYEASINALRLAAITRGCDPLDEGRFCPDSPLTRAQMASFFVRAMGL
jgi:hypothetical protein